MDQSRRARVLPWILILVSGTCAVGQDPTETINLWPVEPPGETKKLPAESDQTKPTDRLIAGRKIIKLGNVSTPQIALYSPKPELANGTAVVICPGGGHYILAYDLEGTEVATWLNSLGVTAIVLKYRVPFRDPSRRYLAAVQDAQRAMSMVRSKANAWKINPSRIGILGFSAGGETAALTSTMHDQRQYSAIDEIDQVSSRPDFAMLIYPGRLIDPKTNKHRDELRVNQETPPMFFVHAFDDRVTVLSSLSMATELKKAGVPAELHIYQNGGHGYGLRRTSQPVTSWPDRAEDWMRNTGLIPKQPEPGESK